MTKTGDRFIEAMEQAVAYAKADEVLRHLEEEAETILTSVKPAFYFAYSNLHWLSESVAIRTRIGTGGWNYELQPGDKFVTREEAIYLIIHFQEMDDEDV